MGGLGRSCEDNGQATFLGQPHSQEKEVRGLLACTLEHEALDTYLPLLWEVGASRTGDSAEGSRGSFPQPTT